MASVEKISIKIQAKTGGLVLSVGCMVSGDLYVGCYLCIWLSFLDLDRADRLLGIFRTFDLVRVRE